MNRREAHLSQLLVTCARALRALRAAVLGQSLSGDSEARRVNGGAAANNKGTACKCEPKLNRNAKRNAALRGTCAHRPKARGSWARRGGRCRNQHRLCLVQHGEETREKGRQNTEDIARLLAGPAAAEAKGTGRRWMRRLRSRRWSRAPATEAATAGDRRRGLRYGASKHCGCRHRVKRKCLEKQTGFVFTFGYRPTWAGAPRCGPLPHPRARTPAAPRGPGR
jgi:hypothetical protein